MTHSGINKSQSVHVVLFSLLSGAPLPLLAHDGLQRAAPGRAEPGALLAARAPEPLNVRLRHDLDEAVCVRLEAPARRGAVGARPVVSVHAQALACVCAAVCV